MTNLSTSSSVRDTNLSLAEFLAVFFFLVYCSRPSQTVSSFFLFFQTSQASRESMGKPLSKVARMKPRDVRKADWPYFHMKKIIVILDVPITIFLSGGNLCKTLQFI